MMTCGPKPKPIHIGATLHTLCINKGQLTTFKVHVQVNGGLKDNNLQGTYQHTPNLEKWINLYNLIWQKFKGKS